MKTRIINIQNDCLTDEEAVAIAEIPDHYEVQNVILTDIKGSKNRPVGHPAKATMQRIADQLGAAVNEKE